MVDTMEAMPGVGLAAPQVGVMLRLAVVDASRERGSGGAAGQPRDPAASAEIGTHDEASPNLPGVWARVARPRAVTVRFLNEAGETEERDFVGLWATSVQHQIDHLDGQHLLRPAVAGAPPDAAEEGREAEAAGMRLVFMGTPGFRGAGAGRAGRRGARDRRGLHPAAAPGRARQVRAAVAGAGPGPRRWALRCATRLAARFGCGGRVRGAGARGGGGRRLWADPAAAGA